MSSTWKIPVERISSAGYVIDEEASTTWMGELLDEPHSEFRWQVLKPTQIHVEIVQEAGMFHLTGHAQLIAACPCVRCMTEVVFQVPVQLNVRLTEGPAVSSVETEELEWSAEADAAMSEDDIAASHYEGGVIDVAALLREQLFLDLPAYPVCDHPSASHPRVCAFHDKHLGGADESIDNRWAGLAAWRNQLPKN